MSTLSSSLAEAKRSAEAIVRELDDPEAEQTNGESGRAEEIKPRSKSPERLSTFSALRIPGAHPRRQKTVSHTTHANQDCAIGGGEGVRVASVRSPHNVRAVSYTHLTLPTTPYV
eukprot:TRINITY_DN9192_c0_g1_i7.p2 TRINITY_DN9192_c0_g1~~TRINITY_DN9192_c0_g1_i7.p2  ORF type:complete len:115 (+),score=11.39 TRINITY_DN9192_c0_g1_i7:610-954(+)